MTLFLVTLIAGTSVGYVYELTREPKARADLEKKISAIRNVTPDFDNNPIKDAYPVELNGVTLTFFPVKNNGKHVATAVSTFSSEGYGGDIHLMVGFLPNGQIYDTAVIEHKETPGLGNKIETVKSDFSRQFEQKDPAAFDLSVKQDGGDVDGITAATISSRAYCDAVQRAYQAYRKDQDL